MAGPLLDPSLTEAFDRAFSPLTTLGAGQLALAKYKRAKADALETLAVQAKYAEDADKRKAAREELADIRRAEREEAAGNRLAKREEDAATRRRLLEHELAGFTADRAERHDKALFDRAEKAAEDKRLQALADTKRRTRAYRVKQAEYQKLFEKVEGSKDISLREQNKMTREAILEAVPTIDKAILDRDFNVNAPYDISRNLKEVDNWGSKRDITAGQIAAVRQAVGTRMEALKEAKVKDAQKYIPLLQTYQHELNTLAKDFDPSLGDDDLAAVGAGAGGGGGLAAHGLGPLGSATGRAAATTGAAAASGGGTQPTRDLNTATRQFLGDEGAEEGGAGAGAGGAQARQPRPEDNPNYTPGLIGPAWDYSKIGLSGVGAWLRPRFTAVGNLGKRVVGGVLGDTEYTPEERQRMSDAFRTTIPGLMWGPPAAPVDAATAARRRQVMEGLQGIPESYGGTYTGPVGYGQGSGLEDNPYRYGVGREGPPRSSMPTAVAQPRPAGFIPTDRERAAMGALAAREGLGGAPSIPYMYGVGTERGTPVDPTRRRVMEGLRSIPESYGAASDFFSANPDYVPQSPGEAAAHQAWRTPPAQPTPASYLEREQMKNLARMDGLSDADMDQMRDAAERGDPDAAGRIMQYLQQVRTPRFGVR